MSQILTQVQRRYRQIREEGKRKAIRRAIESRIEEGLRRAGYDIHPVVVRNLVNRELQAKKSKEVVKVHLGR